MEDIRGNLNKINEEIKLCAERCGRNAEDVLLCAVSKTRTPEEINIAIDAGVTDIGENKVQEIMDKFDAVKPVKWHMIGHLQTNKVKYIIDKVSMIHSVDSYKLAAEINKRAAQHGLVMDILLQVNSAEEESKFGITTDETEKLIKEILDTCENIRIRGLMCIAPYADDPEDIKVYFEDVKKQYDEFGKIDHPRLDFKYLSMGMSHDFPVAIEAGSNLVRVGSAIFGERNYNK
ncbi:MAG: YggS family pyridoxal phosphate-dependent enzyme [Firmicutes bacterium]|nr:YggS family pyridoxal phosphate-dependent enzyme [Bacillota bacterium]MBQ3520411.1 YggS family pyridoxal phosphate-dependent enzyme [Bacillota bacterium]MBR2620082.1 YggS family pyridoxal phosphate-dependent enzyme [Bacillota bacterium]MBR3786916.1 YggS family pyridoxal phosphate-dependent enzyme [Bacillota bacterium]MBR6799941.1 YggS family pyridoxal phosphate-dependent enzyme [Bacillota bacterium]